VNSFHFEGYYKLPFSFQFKKAKQVNIISKGTVCISGKLSSYPTKAAAQKVLEENGYVVKTSITKDVTILFNESGIASSKTKQANEKGITIIENIKAFIEEI
jgi:NAD-dependent DNA ligase